MTKMYQPLYREGCEFCHPIDLDQFETILDLCNGTARAKMWEPLKMELIRNDYGKELAEVDSPWLDAHVLILRPRAISVLAPILLEYGELLPLSCAGAELWLYNVTHVIDALDEPASVIDRFSDGRIILVLRPVLRKHVIGKDDIFKLSHRRAEPIYFSQRFVDLWNSAGLTGGEFDPVWSG
jgi:hypothetical protein